MRHLFLVLIGTALLAPYSPAQNPTKVGEIILATNESARGVSFEWPHAYVGQFTDGIQYKVDISNVNNPLLVTTFNPSWGDEWNENFLYQGLLFTGHRFGGLNMWDVSGAPAQLDSVSTNYHFAGLDVLPFPGNPYLLYGEHNAGTQPACLIVYEFAGGSLVQVGSSLVGGNQRDGRFVLVTSDQWVYQLDAGAGSSRPLNLNIYDLTAPPTPVFCQMYDMGNTAGSAGGLEDLEIHPNERILYAACGLDGLRMLDIGVRCAPVVANTISAPNLSVRELSWLDGTVYLVGSARLPSGQWRFRVADCTVDVNPVPVTGWLGDQDYTIHDLKAISHALGPAVLVVGQNAAGEATLQIWM